MRRLRTRTLSPSSCQRGEEMNQCIIGLLICILLYGLGQLLYPDPIQQRIRERGMARTIVPEPNKLLEESE